MINHELCYQLCQENKLAFCTFTLWLFYKDVHLLPLFEIKEYIISKIQLLSVALIAAVIVSFVDTMYYPYRKVSLLIEVVTFGI